MVVARLIKLGYDVSIPFGNNKRYDLVVDFGSGLKKVQIKTARLKKGVVTFWTCSTNGFTGAKAGYAGQVDVFLAYCPDNECFYKVEVENAPTRNISMRVEPPKKGANNSGIRWAKNYQM